MFCDCSLGFTAGLGSNHTNCFSWLTWSEACAKHQQWAYFLSRLCSGKESTLLCRDTDAMRAGYLWWQLVLFDYYDLRQTSGDHFVARKSNVLYMWRLWIELNVCVISRIAWCIFVKQGLNQVQSSFSVDDRTFLTCAGIGRWHWSYFICSRVINCTVLLFSCNNLLLIANCWLLLEWIMITAQLQSHIAVKTLCSLVSPSGCWRRFICQRLKNWVEFKFPYGLQSSWICLTVWAMCWPVVCWLWCESASALVFYPQPRPLEE